MAAVIWHDGRHYYGKPTDGGASFIIFEFIVLPWPINSSSREIRTVRDLLAPTHVHELTLLCSALLRTTAFSGSLIPSSVAKGSRFTRL